MKLSLDKDSLAAGLATVKNIINNKATLPVLSHVLVKAKGDTLRLSGTDLDIAVSTVVSGVVLEKEGGLCLPANRLTLIANELSGEIDMDADNKSRVTIESGCSRFVLHGMSAEEFPPLDFPIKDGHRFTLTQETLRHLIQRTRFAMSEDQTRFVLLGLFFEFKNGVLTIVSTDGRRLAKVSIASPLEKNTCFILPEKAVNELYRLLSEGTVAVEFDDAHAIFRLMDKEGKERTTLTSRLVQGSFPNYNQVIPDKHEHRVEFNREELAASIHRAALLTSDKWGALRLSFTNNLLTLHAGGEHGESREELAVKWTASDLKVGFNPDYLSDCLGVLDDETVTLELIDPLSPGVFKASGEFTYIIMPLKLSDDQPAATATEPASTHQVTSTDEPQTKTKKATKKGSKNENSTRSANQPAEAVAS